MTDPVSDVIAVFFAVVVFQLWVHQLLQRIFCQRNP